MPARVRVVRLVAAATLVAALGATAAAGARAPGARGAAVLLPALSRAHLAGQRIVYAYAGTTPPAALLALVRAGEAAGVIFFAPNAPSVAVLRAAVAALRQANAASPVHVPLLLMTDQEGGLVRRLPGAPALSERQIGASSGASALASAAGAGAAATLRGAGLNVNLAPVLDVYRTPGNFIDRYQRSYSSDPQLAGTLGAAFIRAQQAAGVAATAKHFPGLGAAGTSQDTDVRAVTIPTALASLRAVDEAPYRAAIAAGARLVMVSWAVYPALDATAPAGLSARVIQGELRGRLGFAGVTITDGLGAGALVRYGGFDARAVRAARAGADLVLCTVGAAQANGPAIGLAALHGLEGALAHGTLAPGAFRQAVARVITLRASL